MRKLLIILLFPVFASAQFTMPSTVGFNKPVTSSAPLSPKDTAGLIMWLYSDTLGLADNDPVANWTDLSGNSNDALQSSAGLKPTYKTNVQNGRAVLRFDGTSDYMETASTSIGSGLTGLTVFVVVKQSSLALNKAIIAKWDYATDGTFAIQTSDAATDETMMYVANGCTSAGSEHQNSTDADLTTDFYILTYVFDGSQGTNADRVKIYRNGTLVSMTVTGTINTALTSCGSTMKIVNFGGILNTRWWNGDMGEILMYDHALTPTGITTWNDWLKKPDRWGL